MKKLTINPMNLHDLSWDRSTLESDDCFDNVSILNKKPFENEELSDEFVYSVSQEDLFLDKEIKNKYKIVFKNNSTWSKKVRDTMINQRVVYSAPQPSNINWNNIDSGEIHTLPTLGCGKSDSIRRISAETASALIAGKYQKDYLFIDARYKYEYEGGHIKNAIHCNDILEAKKLLNNPKILIFYCEFSSVRAPSISTKLRNIDRKMNNYPKLNCPEIYVLEGGYNNFYNKYPDLCDPSGYIMMHDSRYSKECAEENRKKKSKRI